MRSQWLGFRDPRVRLWRRLMEGFVRVP
jgi:hypothetical protein